jgi:Tol biopolymer transport system component/DNA-binding winged helix-turn-helix (wHTH) protein
MSNNGNSLRRFGQYEIDLEMKILWVNGTLADLPVKAVELLCVLIESDGRVVSKDELLDAVWRDSFVEEGVLPQNVYLLRKIFKENGSNENLIQTVARRGYRFTGSVENFTEEIVFERETLEQKFIAELDVSNGEAKQINPPAKTNRKFIYYAFGISAALFLGLFVYLQFFKAESKQFENANLQYERLTASGRAFWVGLSPDNQNAAYVIHTAYNKYSLILHHLPTKSETVIIQPQEKEMFSIHFSPDGHHIFYVVRGGNKPKTIYRIPIYGGTPQAVSTGLSHHFTISPDGEWLAFYRVESDITKTQLVICRSRDGSEEKIVATLSGKRVFEIWGIAPAWSADGQKFVAVVTQNNTEISKDNSHHLVEINRANGAETPLKTPEWNTIGQAFWKPDGKNLMVLAHEKAGEPAQIWELEYPSGKARNLTNDTNHYREFRSAADSGFLLTSTWTKSENLFLVPIENPSQVRQLTFDSAGRNGAFGLKWTTDGKSLIYTRGKAFTFGNLWMLNTETLENKQLTFDEAAFQNYIDVTPDGKSAVFGSNRAGVWHIWQVDLDGENLRQITDGIGEVAPEISPDGKWLYFLTPGDIPDTLWKMPLAGGEPVKVLDKVAGTSLVSPVNPNHIVFYFYDENEKNADKFKFMFYAPEKITDLKIDATVRFDWKADGSGIYFNNNAEGFNNVNFVSLADQKQTRITEFTDQRINTISVSPDGKNFALSRGSSIGNIIKISGF